MRLIADGGDRIGRRLAALLLLLFCILFSTSVSATETGRLVLLVRDEETGQPIPIARILTTGEAALVGYTEDDGTVTLEDMPQGAFSATIVKTGYRTLRSPSFNILAGRTTNLSARLRKVGSNLKTIGSVTVRFGSEDGSSASNSSPIGIISDTLGDALYRTPQVEPGFNGFGALPDTFSIGGTEAQEVGISLDGIPISLPGRGINTDLFSSAGITQTPANGSIGGALNFHGLQPTIAWTGQLEASYGSFDKKAAIASMRGSIGNLGVAVVHAERTLSNPLNGALYLDQSGFDYQHGARAVQHGTYVRLRSSVGRSQIASATIVSTGTNMDATCFVFAALLPCGYGPGNQFRAKSSTVQLSDEITSGETVIRVLGFQTRSDSEKQFLQRSFAREPLPEFSASRAALSGFSVSANFSPARRHSVNANVFADSIHTSFLQNATAYLPPVNVDSTSTLSGFALSDKFRASSQLSIGASVGIDSFAAGRTVLNAAAAASWTYPKTTASLGISAGIGGLSAPIGSALTDPRSLMFDCNAGRVFANGPGGVPSPAQAQSVYGSATHSFGAHSISLSASRTVVFGGSVFNILSGDQVSPGLFPPGYFSAAAAVFASGEGCGYAKTLHAPDFFIAQPIPVDRRLYQHVSLRANVSLGTHLVLAPFYTINVAQAAAGPALLHSPNSIIRVGAQLPGIPLQRAGIAIDFAPSSHIEGAVDAIYTSANNSQNLPAFTTVSAALQFTASRGTFVASATNLFNTLAGRFVSPGTVTLPTLGGSPVALLAVPNRPREFSLRYLVGIGKKAQPRSSLVDDASEHGSVSLAFKLLPLPATPPPSPFELNSGSENCVPEKQGVALAILDALKQDVARIEASRQAGEYPGAFPTFETPSGIKLRYEKVEHSYALDIALPGFTAQSAFLACSVLHGGFDIAKLRAAGAYIPPNLRPHAMYPFFQPSLGLYVVIAEAATAQEEARFVVHALPSVPPLSPLQIEAGHTCRQEYAPMARHLLSSLGAFVSELERNEAAPRDPDGWRVTVSRVGQEHVIGLRLADALAQAALRGCAHISRAAPSELRGIGYPELRGLYFSRRFGLFEVVTK